MYILILSSTISNMDRVQFDYNTYLQKVYNSNKTLSNSSMLQDGTNVYRPYLPDTVITKTYFKSNETWAWLEKEIDTKFDPFTDFYIYHHISKIDEVNYKYIMNMHFTNALDYRIYKYYYKPKLKINTWNLKRKNQI